MYCHVSPLAIKPVASGGAMEKSDTKFVEFSLHVFSVELFLVL